MFSSVFSVDFDYPDFDATFMEPKQPGSDSVESSASSTSVNSVSSMSNGDISGSFPKIDRSTKPKVDRSTKINVANNSLSSVSSNKSLSGSLYPDVGAISKPGNSLYSKSTETGSSITNSNFKNTDYRAESASNMDNKNISSTNLATQSTEISDELQALNLQKKKKMEELQRLQQHYEKMEAESRARIEQMKTEEKKLSDLEDLKRKQQSDVADLMR